MKYFVIADPDTVIGFRYVGVQGQEVRNAEEARHALVQVQRDQTIGIVIINDKIAASIQPEIDALRIQGKRPLVVEIPGTEGPMPGGRTLLDVIREAIGISV